MPRTGVSNTRCCVPGCHSKKQPSISFHIFPLEKKSWVLLRNKFGVEEKVDRLQAWLIKLNMGPRLSRRAVVCSLHFTTDDYILPDCPTQKRRLKLTAVPSLNLPKTSHEAAVETKALVEEVQKKINVGEIDASCIGSCSSGPSQGILHYSAINSGNVPTVRKVQHLTLSREGSSDHMAVCDIPDGIDCVAIENCTSGPSQGIHHYSAINSGNVPKTIDMPNVRKVGHLTLSREGSSDHMEVCEIPDEIDCLATENCTSTEKDAIEAFLKLGHAIQPCQSLDKGIQVTSGDLVSSSITDRITSRSQLVTMTGIPSFELLNTIVDLCTEMFHRSKKYKLSMKECIIFTFIKLKTGITYAVLSVLFNITKASCKTVFHHTLSMLAKVLKPVIYWPSLDEVKENVPTCFQDFLNVRVVVDCTEIPVEKVKCLCCRLRTYSQYKKHHTVKFMTGVSPSGLITFISKAYGGRASDTEIFKQSGLIERCEMFRDHIMVDKGFLIQDFAGEYGIKVIQPPFLKKKPQFSKEEALLNAKIARARVHIERSNQRIKMFAILGRSLPYNLLPQVDNIITIICAIVNLSAPIFGDDKFL